MVSIIDFNFVLFFLSIRTIKVHGIFSFWSKHFFPDGQKAFHLKGDIDDC